ncbi:YoaK family protein [Furfurilactobacillus milii]|uniref:DUF1275 domain-containing protein n=1 Tax=Furfurilactobacillus milii TaxID=2888272 RepID=A0A6N9I386_9LACO|nr:YoaK family protein [Furfurilactobacillus milii]MYV16856.1 DUF1275 domain-containing protein [Furfurilactobacillus milii]
MKNVRQPIYETLLIGTLLAGVGGYLDAYTYILHNEVFASLQSGNVILLGLNLANGHFAKAITYIIPIFCFTLGAGLANLVEQFFHRPGAVIWQELSIIAELVGILIIDLFIGFIPGSFITSSLSLFAAFQVHTFRVMNNHPYNTTMTTGNLRTVGAASLNLLFRRGKLTTNWILLRDSFWVAASFGIGAFISTKLTNAIGPQALLGSVLILIVVLILMIWDQRGGTA